MQGATEKLFDSQIESIYIFIIFITYFVEFFCFLFMSTENTVVELNTT